MKFLVVVAPPSIYHGCSTRKTFWEEKFTGKKQDLFVSVNMRNCGQLHGFLVDGWLCMNRQRYLSGDKMIRSASLTRHKVKDYIWMRCATVGSHSNPTSKTNRHQRITSEWGFCRCVLDYLLCLILSRMNITK